MFSNALKILAAIAVLSLATLAQTGGIKGKVRTLSGNGIGGASISVRQNGEDLKKATADNKGNFQIDGLAAGKYNVLFEAPGYSGGVLYNVEIRKNLVRDLGDKLMLTVDRGTLILIEGSVFYKEGFTVTGAKVECEEVLPDGTTKKIGSTESNADGEFRFRLPQGPKKLRFRATMKGITVTKDLNVEEPARYGVALSLDLSKTEK